MAGMGPAPDPNSRRRKSGQLKNGMTVLPAAGRSGATPSWPLFTDPSNAELDLWDSLWRKPQAVMWEREGSERVVARYAMVVILAENPSNPSAALLSEVRQLEDRLGLSPMAMKRLMWSVEQKKEREGHLAEVKQIDRFKDL